MDYFYKYLIIKELTKNGKGLVFLFIVSFFFSFAVTAQSFFVIGLDLKANAPKNFSFPQGFEWLGDLPPCGEPIKTMKGQSEKGNLCKISFVSGDSFSALFEVCFNGSQHLEAHTFPELKGEGIYIFISGSKPQRFQWFDPNFNHWACYETYPIQPGRGRFYKIHYFENEIIKIIHNWEIQMATGLYELRPDGDLLKIIKEESESWT